MRAATVDRARLASLMRDEEERFVRSHPRSRERAERAARHLVAGVPMPWMRRWPGAFPLSLERASGARFTCADGIEYVDLCLGDTGAMTGHAVPEISAAVAAQMSRGSTVMLPTEDAAWAGAELARRFGLNLQQAASAPEGPAGAPPVPLPQAEAPSVFGLLWARVRRWLGLG